MKSTIRSVWSGVAGIVAGVVLTVVTDTVLEQTGVLVVTPFDKNSFTLILIVVLYRTIYNILGSYITARLAPSNPMKHVMVVGTIGVVVNLVGTIVMWHIPPHWYPITLTVLALPCAWVGGKLALGATSKD